MAVASYVNPERRPRGFMTHLSSVALEWLLMSLLFVYAAFSYFLTKFAQYCELQTPCLLCSRLDHIFGNEKPGFYRSLFCNNHRTEVSSLLCCQIHSKLADAQGMCEECLMSSTMQNKSNPESFRLLVGKLGVHMEQTSLQSPCLNKNFIAGSLSARTCSCCNKIWRARPNASRLLQLNPAGYGTVKPSIKPPLPRVPGRSRLSRRDSFKKLRDKISGPAVPRRIGLGGVDPLSHVGYSELKITSDSESEFPFSDDDDGCSVNPEDVGSEELPNLASPRQTPMASDPQPSLMDQKIELIVKETRDFSGHGLGELNWEPAKEKPQPSSLPELISLDDVPTSTDIVEGPSSVSPPKKSTLLGLSELMTLKHVAPASNISAEKSKHIVMETPPKVSAEKAHTVGTNDVEQISEVPEVASTTVSADQQLIEAVPSVTNAVDPNDGDKFVAEKGTEVSGPVEIAHESAKVEDQVGPEPKDSSIEVHGHHDGSQVAEALSSNATTGVQNSALLDKNEYDYESLGEGSVSDVEGESIVERLKRQIEYDRRCISDLQRDLDEERSASEVAADQAMAMITRLQEEKALLHMEALQYLRMMEEQAEYDMEALEKSNELLSEKEKEVQDLEAELDYFRVHFPDDEALEAFLAETSPLNLQQNLKVENNGAPHIRSSSSDSFDDAGKHENIMTALLDFEGEKLYISQRLKKLEEKLQQLSSNGEVKKSPRQFLPNGETSEEENGSKVPKVASPPNGSGHIPKDSGVTVEDVTSSVGENGGFNSTHDGESESDTVGNEISDLYGRLNGLEGDHDFLEQAFDSLKKGKDGSKFIQEISQELQELRRHGLQKRSLPVP